MVHTDRAGRHMIEASRRLIEASSTDLDLPARHNLILEALDSVKEARRALRSVWTLTAPDDNENTWATYEAYDAAGNLVASGKTQRPSEARRRYTETQELYYGPSLVLWQSFQFEKSADEWLEETPAKIDIENPESNTH